MVIFLMFQIGLCAEMQTWIGISITQDVSECLVCLIIIINIILVLFNVLFICVATVWHCSFVISHLYYLIKMFNVSPVVYNIKQHYILTPTDAPLLHLKVWLHQHQFRVNLIRLQESINF